MTKPVRRVICTVSFDLPDDASGDDAREYVQNAIATYSGSLRPHSSDGPGDPMFYLDKSTIHVTRKLVVRKKV